MYKYNINIVIKKMFNYLQILNKKPRAKIHILFLFHIQIFVF